jgi:hypothetical protein
VDDAVIGRVAEAAADVGLNDLAQVAERLREVGIGA